jgi:putative radical SAM enzyme (TIGR03279 family)
MMGVPDRFDSPGVISAVAPSSLANRIGLEAEDELLSVNGHPVRDVIDVRFYASEPLLQLQVRRSGEIRLWETERRPGEPLGLTFVDPIFDRIRRCDNRCEFCFVAQMPRGLRSSLYVKDDDYRTSFLFGSYVTLTNVTEADWRRIEEQHLSPLYLSVHATEPDVRRRFLGNPDAPDVLAQLRRLTTMGIVVHTQVVVRPGINDGVHLDASIEDLSTLHPAVRSVSVVPVGLTRHHRFDCRLPTDDEMQDVLDQVARWQEQLRRRCEVAFAYLSDEWYLRLGEDVPPMTHYDDLDLTENGVGLVRQFLDIEQERLLAAISDLGSVTLVTGTLFAPVLRAAVVSSGAEVVSVVNHFFGESVTVAGLLTAEDVIAQLQDRELGEVVLLPASMFAGPEGQSLDEMWPKDVEQALGRRVVTGLP